MKLDDSDNTSEQAKSPTPTDTNTSFKEEAEKILVKAFKLVKHPDKNIKGWWHETPLYDEDFEQVTGHQYKNAEEYLEAALTSIINLVDKEVIGDMEYRETLDMGLSSWSNEDFKAFGRNELRNEQRAIIGGSDE